ncbi:SusC/RagA family TonB-linked outer membrane protein [Xylanibacter brevis]|uniref:SusC/RagA family TonB-linked outer membrane protein n=1 Tax=Xylanibacter brevis TaxID=83231 RepID=UPI000A51446E|nr:TonB-dependent receptor [Xylanibacter brevis]
MMKQVNIKLPFRMLALVVGIFLTLGAFAQNITVKGHVKDATGEAIIGATVRVADTQNATVTDFDGNFTLQANQGATIQISYVGYQVATVKATHNVVVTLQEDQAVINEIVVIGYGRAKKNDLTGSVTAIKPDEMSHGLQTSADDMLSGKVAGLNIVNEGGAPGAGSTIRIRGGASLNASNEPLYVVDGLQLDPAGISGMNPLASINPNDIESFTVLKDASATAIYGSRASNGVIIITTKKGKTNSAPKVSFNGSVSISMKKKTLDVFDGPGFKSFIADKFGEDSPEYALLGYRDANGNQLFANTDWQDEIYRTAIQRDYNITVTGGTAHMPYRISGGFTNQPGIVKSTFFRRYTGSFNLAPELLNDHLRLNISGKIMNAERRWDNGAVGAAAYMDPTKPIHMDQDLYKDYFNGYYQWAKAASYPNDNNWQYAYDANATANPVALTENNGTLSKALTVQGNFGFDYAIHGFEDLHILGNLAGNLTRARQETTNSPLTTSSYYYGWDGWSKNNNYNHIFNIFAQYTKELVKDVHNIDAQVGYEWQRYHAESDNYGYGRIPETASVGAGDRYNEPTGITEWKSENRLRSWIGRVNYTLLNRYLFTFTMRADGSSRFDTGEKWGYFPAAAFAWRVKEESFLRDNQTINDLKIRLTYGKTGQQNIGYDFYYMPTFTANYDHAYYPIFGNGQTVRPGVYNPDLTWEKTTTYDAGFDISLWNNRFSLTADWYYRKTTDLINNVYVPAGANFGAQTVGNIGKLHNTGVEVMTTVRPIVSKDLSWEITYNFTYNKNKIDDLASDLIEYGGIGLSKNGKAYQTGHSASSFYVYRQVYDEKGNIVPHTFVDRNGNGILDSGDRYFYYHSDPDFTMGLGSKVIYKNWDLSFNSRANIGNHVFNANINGTYISAAGLGSVLNFMHNIPTQALKYGLTDSSNAQACSDCWIQNASFFKLDNVTLGYSFKKLFGSDISGRVYATAQNILTITDYDGLDPEIQGGIESNIYPRPFTTVIGVNLNF